MIELRIKSVSLILHPAYLNICDQLYLFAKDTLLAFPYNLYMVEVKKEHTVDCRRCGATQMLDDGANSCHGAGWYRTTTKLSILYKAKVELFSGSVSHPKAPSTLVPAYLPTYLQGLGKRTAVALLFLGFISFPK